MKQNLWADGSGMFILESVSVNKVFKKSTVHQFTLPKYKKRNWESIKQLKKKNKQLFIPALTGNI